MGTWDTPPTKDEVASASKGPWDAPPTQEEMAAAQKAAQPEQPKGLIGSAVGAVKDAVTNPEWWKAAAHGVGQGATLGFRDEGEGAVMAGLQALANVGAKLNANGHPGLADALGKVGIEAHYQPESITDEYRRARDEARTQDFNAMQSHPGGFLLGNLAGALATGKAYAKGANALPGMGGTRLARILKGGALLGGAAGLGTSTADKPADMALDALGAHGLQQTAQDVSEGQYGRGALDLLGSGAVGGATAGLGAELAPVLARGVGSKLREAGIDAGRRALYNISQRLSAAKEIPTDAVQTALEAKAIPPGANAKGIANALVDSAERSGMHLGDVIDRAGQYGVQVPVAPVVNELGAQAVKEMPLHLTEAVPNIYKKAALAIMERLGGGEGDTADIRAMEALKRDAQETASAAYKQFNPSSVGQAHMGVASTLRQASEDALERASETAPPGSDLSGLADEFLAAKRQYGNLAQARDLAIVGKARGASRTAGGLIGEEIAADGLRQIIDGNPAEGLKDFALKNAFQLYRSRMPSLLANALYFGGKSVQNAAPTLQAPYLSELVTALQRAKETAKPKPPQQDPITVDEQGRPHIIVHTGR